MNREVLRKAYAEAARDERFLDDVRRVLRDFRVADEDPELQPPP